MEQVKEETSKMEYALEIAQYHRSRIASFEAQLHNPTLRRERLIQKTD